MARAYNTCDRNEKCIHKIVIKKTDNKEPLGRPRCILDVVINRLTPNDPYMGRTAPLTSKHCILYIYSTNVGTEYFKHALYSPFFLFKMQFVS